MKNYFEIFKIEKKFDIDLDDLEQKYLNFQKNFHPDKAGIDEIEKSILINEGYDVLSDDFKRAAHILQLENIDIENDEKAPKVDQETLIEILTIQEEIAAGTAKKSQLKQQLQDNLNNSMKIVIAKLDSGEFLAAAQNLIKAKYYKKSLKDLKKSN